jgi:uncharacterized protein YcaQ
MNELTLSVDAARALHLSAQGMLLARRRKASKDDVLEAIRRMGMLQIDTINVVARSPYFVLWSRLGDYEPGWLDEHLAEGRVFEYWAHEACFVPIEDYGLYRHRMIEPEAMGWKYSASWVRERAAEVEHVLAHIRANGPTRSSDFERSDGNAGGWWEWKSEKRALEMLFTSGALMIARRHNFQRVYDLAERVYPGWDDTQMPPLAEVQRQFVLRAVKALGLARASWIPDYHRTRKPHLDPESLVAKGELLRARVSGWREPVYIHPENAATARDAAAGLLAPTLTTLLSPFDPIVWDRRRALDLFDFDYRLECYTPEHKRRHGYFTLPILRRGVLAGRIDAKAHRGSGVFELKSVILEPGVRVTARLVRDIAGAVLRCARWHRCRAVQIRASSPTGLGQQLATAIDDVLLPERKAA